MKQLFYLSLLTILFLAYDVSAFQSLDEQSKNCTFSHYSDITGIEVVDLGDRQIYTLSTEHLVNEREIIFAAFSNPTSSMHFSMMLDEIIKNNQAVIESEQSDVQKIVELFRSEQIDWIGLETSPEQLEVNPIDVRIRGYFENKDFLNTNLNRTDGWNSNKTEKILSLIYNPYIIALAGNLNLFNGVEIIPLDSYDLRGAEAQYYNDIDHDMNLLRTYHVRVGINQSVVTSFSHFIKGGFKS